MFKTVRALRTVKVVNFLVIGADTLIQIKVMIQRIFLCIPHIFQLIPVILMIFYIYGIFGIEFFNKDTRHAREDSPFGIYHYASFTSFGGS